MQHNWSLLLFWLVWWQGDYSLVLSLLAALQLFDEQVIGLLLDNVQVPAMIICHRAQGIH